MPNHTERNAREELFERKREREHPKCCIVLFLVQMEMMRVKDCDKKNVAHIKLRTPANLFGNIPKVYTWRSMRATR